MRTKPSLHLARDRARCALVFIRVLLPDLESLERFRQPRPALRIARPVQTSRAPRETTLRVLAANSRKTGE